MTKRPAMIVVACLLCLPSPTLAAGAAHNANFIVLAPDKALAQDVLTQAEQFRAGIARETFGVELPPGVGRTIVHVELSPTDDRTVVWPIDRPGRRYHIVWLVTDQAGATGRTLRAGIARALAATDLTVAKK